MNDFTKRLRWCIKHGDMTVADLHHWFTRPRATVRRWVIDACVPYGPSGNRAHLLLGLLEEKIDKRRGFPVPVELSARERPAYIKKMRHGNNGGRVSSSYSAGGRA